jgi:hypothetical protein
MSHWTARRREVGLSIWSDMKMRFPALVQVVLLSAVVLGGVLSLVYIRTSDFAPDEASVSVNTATGEYCCLPGAELTVQDAGSGRRRHVPRPGFDRISTLGEVRRDPRLRIIDECSELGCFDERIQLLSRAIEGLLHQTYSKRWIVTVEGRMIWRANLHPVVDDDGRVIATSEYSREVVDR